MLEKQFFNTLIITGDIKELSEIHESIKKTFNIYDGLLSAVQLKYSTKTTEPLIAHVVTMASLNPNIQFDYKYYNDNIRAAEIYKFTNGKQVEHNKSSYTNYRRFIVKHFEKFNIHDVFSYKCISCNEPIYETEHIKGQNCPICNKSVFVKKL